MSSHGEKPDHYHYLVTEDLAVLMGSWAKRTGFIIPDVRWFANNHRLLRHALEHALESDERVVLVDSLPHQYMVGEIQRLVYQLHSSQELDIELGCVISLDQVYAFDLNCPHELLDVNRVTDIHCVTGEQIGVIGHAERPGFALIDAQIEALRRKLTSCYVVVVDDGIYTGKTMQWVLSKLREHHMDVKAIVVGVHVKHPGQVVDYGISGNYVRSVECYSTSRPVLDWVCERDFFIGTPLGGRTIKGQEVYSSDSKAISTGAYYPMKQRYLADWASITDLNFEFSNFCLDRSIELFAEIERLSGRSVLLGDLERLPVEVHNDEPDLNTTVRGFLGQLRE